MSAPSLSEHLSAWGADSRQRMAIAHTVNALADACGSISQLVGAGALAGALGATRKEHGAGDSQKELDVRANDMLVAGLRKGSVAALAP